MKVVCKFVGFKDYFFMKELSLNCFFLKKWFKFIKMEIYKEVSYEIFKCIVSLLIFF